MVLRSIAWRRMRVNSSTYGDVEASTCLSFAAFNPFSKWWGILEALDNLPKMNDGTSDEGITDFKPRL